MAKTVRNSYYKNLTYEKLMQAHIKSRKEVENVELTTTIVRNR